MSLFLVGGMVTQKLKVIKLSPFRPSFELIWGIAKKGPHHKVTAGVQEKQSRLSLPAF
jgi:hypothetical protein